MHPWELRYGSKPKIVVYTDRPELITDSLDRWTIEFRWPMDIETVKMFRPPRLLEKYVSRTHDRNLDFDSPHCLYIVEPVGIDLSNLYTCMDLDHTMYYDRQHRFAVYRRDKNFSIKTIDLDIQSKTGVIFIDCWEVNIHYSWVYSNDYSPNENFYQRMISNLWKYNLHSFVFLNSNFGPKPLANLLKGWEQQPWSRKMATIKELQQHITNTGIKHWIVVGGHWGFCTHDKGLGFNNLLKLKQQDPFLHFYSLPDSTAKFVRNNDDLSILTVCTKEDYLHDSLEWEYNSELPELKIP